MLQLPNSREPSLAFLKNCPAEPAPFCGKVNPSRTICPVPFGVIVISPLVFSDVIALPSILMLSTKAAPNLREEVPKAIPPSVAGIIAALVIFALSEPPTFT